MKADGQKSFVDLLCIFINYYTFIYVSLRITKLNLNLPGKSDIAVYSRSEIQVPKKHK